MFKSASLLQAQDAGTSSLRWEIEQTEVKDGSELSYECVFETSPNTVRWVQKRGSISSVYTVKEKEGTWADVNREGSLILHLERNGVPIKMTMTDKNGQRLILLDFSSNASMVRRTFRVKAVTAVN